MNGTMNFSIHPPPISAPRQLVLASSGLTCLQLLQIPSTYLHISFVLVQTFCELLSIHFTASRSPAILSLLIWCSHGGRLLLLNRRAGSASKKAANSVAYRRTNCYTCCSASHLSKKTWSLTWSGSGGNRRWRRSSSRIRRRVCC